MNLVTVMVMVYETTVLCSVRLSNLALNLSYDVDPDELIEFILDIDARVADLQFSKNLRDKLNEIIEREETDE